MEPSERTVESVMKIHRMMKVLADEIRKDVQVLTDPQAKAIFESSIHSIETSIKALLDFEQEKLPDPRMPSP
jgi:RIO-like serine/threonine protein kinase